MSEDSKFDTGAVRSADRAKYAFTSLPPIGLLALARTAGEGAEKYGKFNYMQGMPIDDLLEHAILHIIMHRAGDRSEPHLPHAAWGLLVAAQEEILRPEAQQKHMLGPGCTINPAMQAYLNEQAPILAERRRNLDKDAFNWDLNKLPEVQKIVEQRKMNYENAAKDIIAEGEDLYQELSCGEVQANGVSTQDKAAMDARAEKAYDGATENLKAHCTKIVCEYNPIAGRCKKDGCDITAQKIRAADRCTDKRNSLCLAEREAASYKSDLDKAKEGVSFSARAAKVYEEFLTATTGGMPEEPRNDSLKNRAGRKATESPDPLIPATISGATKFVPARIWHKNLQCEFGREAATYSAILMVSRPEDYYALMSEHLVHKHTLVIERSFWENAPPYEPFTVIR